MPKSNFLKNLSEQLSEHLPSHLATLKQDFERNCQQILHQTLAKLEVVTREEFEVQRKVLLRTRKKLEELEEQVAELERMLKMKDRQ